MKPLLHRTPLLLSLLLAGALLAVFSAGLTAAASPQPPIPHHFFMDPPTALDWLTLDAAVAAEPYISGRVFYDRNCSGSFICERGIRDITVSLFEGQALVMTMTTDIAGKYRFDALAVPADYLVMFDEDDPDLPPDIIVTTLNPITVSLTISNPSKDSVYLGVHSQDSVQPLEVVFSEIAWMGTTVPKLAPADFDPENANDEWIELHNTTDRTIDLSCWTLTAADGQPSIRLTGAIQPGGYYLLERSDDASAPGVLADQLYTGALENDGEDLTLNDGFSVIDRVDAWYAGDNASKETMLRIDESLPGTDPAAWANGPINGDPETFLVDNDADTYFYSPNHPGPSFDCNDNDAAIHPGVPELPNFRDDDCDGLIDEGVPPPVVEPYEGSVYFSDVVDAWSPVTTPAPMENALVSLLDSATETIDAAVYGFDRASLRDALIRARDRGVRVRVVGDDDAYGNPHYQPYYQAIEDAGIPVTYDGRSSAQRNKFAIMDNETVWTGSTNWTDNGFTYHANDSIAITSPHLAEFAYTVEFEEMFDPLLGVNGVCKSDNTVHEFNLGGALVESYFSPTDGAPDEFGEEFVAADESIYFVVFSLNEAICDMLIDKFNQGVAVNGIFDAAGAASQYSCVDRLCTAGVPVKVENWGGKAHDSFIVMDANDPAPDADPRIVTGSYNWTGSGTEDEDNDEDMLIVHEAATAQAYYQEFVRLYDVLPPDTICSDHSAESGMPACQDGVDNDFNGYVDLADWACRESTPQTCQDGLDNDGDTLFDTDDLDCYRCRLEAQGISGQDTVPVGQPLTLTVVLSPNVGPLTYAWSDHPATAETAIYTWAEPGVYVVTATVGNWCKTVAASHTVTVEAASWEIAYSSLFDSRSDLERLRRYRDDVLAETTTGRLYVDLLYRASDEALQVLLDNPELMAQARALFAQHDAAIAAVLSGRPGAISDTAQVLAFLDAYAQKAPPALRLLARMVQRDMLARQKEGRLFFGFQLN